MKIKSWLDLKKDRAIDRAADLATSEDEALAYCANKILRYRTLRPRTTYLFCYGLFFTYPLAILIAFLRSGDLIDLVLAAVSAAFLATCAWVICEGIKSAQDPRYDWAEEYRDIVDEWRAQRYLERKKGMRMADFHYFRRWR